MANVLKREKQEQVIRCLVDGASIRATERITDTHRDTVMRLMVKVGQGCANLMDEELRNLSCKRIEVDEVWSFVYKKQRHLTNKDDPQKRGDIWTFVALDSDTKLIPAFKVGKRTKKTTNEFVFDLASRLDSRVQFSSDAFENYVEAIWWAFAGKVNYGQVVKSYESEPIGPGRYAPPRVSGIERSNVIGTPELALISTSFVERQNLSMRTAMRRLTRLSLGFSKKLENHEAATALHIANYNLCRVHRTIKTTPAVAAGVMFQPWTVSDLLDATI